MQNTTKNYKLEINKPSREFECKITIGNNIYNNDELVNLTLEHTQTQEGFSIGDTISQSLDLTLLNRGDIIYSTSQIKVEIGLKIGSTIEYILMGIFNIDDIEKTDYTTKFTAYDNMIKFETPYFSSLGDKPTLKQVVNELSKITGIEFIGSLPNYTVSKLEGFTCREVLSYVASICGGNAVITRDGKFTIKSLSEIKKSIDGNNYFDYKREEVKYKIGKISCQIDENNILYKGSTGTDSMELGFENPWVTETILNDLYNKLNGLSYLGYSMKWQGDLSLDPYDIVTVTDIKNVIRKIPILSQKISYTGGLTSEIGAKGETKNKNSFSSSGSTVNKVNRAIIEQAIIKEALIEKANIKDVEAVSIRTQILEAKTAKIEEAIIDVAHISDLNTINANIQNLIANDVKINNALINKADITELNAVVGNINIINSELANIKTLVNGNLSSENIQAGGITSDKLTIANGFITNAMIANLDVSKINAGNISTNKFRIVSDNGGIEIIGATQQFKDKNNKVRIQMGQDAKGNFNFILRGEDGTTTLIDHTGIKEKAIADNLIKGNMVATDAIGEKQINYSSLITGLNKDTNTQLIKASKVAIDFVGQSLEVAFNSLKNQADNAKLLIENHSTTIGVMQGQINTAINNTQIVKDGKTILLKDDYNRTVSKVDSINSTIGTHTTKINELTGNITSVDTKFNSIQRDLEGTKSTVSSHTNLIDGLNSKVSTQGSSIEQLKNQITLKVNSTELTTMKNELIGKIDSIEIGGRNTLLNATGNLGNTNHWSNVVLDTNKKVEGCNSFKITRNNFANGNARYQGSQTIDLSRLSLKSNDYITLSGWVYVDSSINLTGSSNEFAFRNYYNSSSSFEDLCVFKYTNVQKNTWTKFSVTSKVTKDSYKAGALLLSISANGLIYVSKLKLEKGSKATDFTLAPEDIDSVIGTKANKTDVYVKSEVYTKSQTDSAINIAKDSINLGVSQTYETKSNVTAKVNTAKAEAISTASDDTTNKVNSAKTELNTKIDEIQVGGRNLIPDSAPKTTGGGWAGTSGTKSLVSDTVAPFGQVLKATYSASGTGGGSYKSPKARLTVGKVYSWSVWLKASKNMNMRVGMEQGGVKTCSVTTTWQKFSHTFTATDYPNHAFIMYVSGTTVTSGDHYFAHSIMVEEGNKPSDWSPAPEDINASIEAKASKTDVYTKSETYSKTETDSAIKVAKDSIELGIKNTYETKSNVTTKVNEAINGIQVGSRNLMRDSKETVAFTNFTGGTNTTMFYRKVYLTPDLKAGDKISVSLTYKYKNITLVSGQEGNARLYVQGSGNVTGWSAGFNSSPNVISNITKGNTNELTLYQTYTFTLSEAQLSNQYFSVGLRTDYIKTGSLSVYEMKVEKGSKSTAWTPAPEDVQGMIDSKANTADVYTKSETYTKAQTDSAIKVVKDEINLGVSNTYETKNNVTNKINSAKTEAINSANSSTDTKLKSYSTTTQMNSAIQVAKDSITNTVSSTYAKRADVESTYATKSSLTQTANNITAKFEASGGYNLVKNSVFKKGLSGWNTDNIDTEGTSKSITYWTDSNQYVLPDTNAVVIRGTNLTGRYGISQNIKIKRGQKYTVSALSASHRGKTIRITVRNSNGGGHLLNVTSTNLASAGKNIAGWNKMEGVFTAPTDSDAIVLCLYMDCSANDGYVWFTQLMINEGDVKQPWSPHPDEVYTGSTVIDASGITVNNGALRVKNNAGKTVLSGDSNGNLDITGTVKSQRGNMYVSLDYGGLTFQSAHNNEQLLRMETTSFTSNKDINGVDLNLAKQGEYISFNHINKENLNNGWSSSDGRYNFMDFWSKDTTLGSKTYKKGINVNSPMYVNKGLKLYSGTNFYADIDGAISWNNGTGTVSNLLGMYGDNGAVLGYKSGESFNARFLVTEDSHPGTGDNLISWGNYNFNGYTFHNANIVAKSLSVQGSKNCLQETKSYGARLINAYETAEYYFGDIGFGQINEEGVCYVDIDDVFLECVNTDAQYHVFTQIYNGKITSIERYKTYFIVKGEQNTEFSWELKAKRKGYEINRLDLPDIETQGDEIDIFSFENEIETDEEDLMKELTFELENLLLKEYEEDE